MKKIGLIVLLINCVMSGFAQEILINGNSKNRLLTWDDFTGKPDKSSQHKANTHWKIYYSFSGTEQAGNLVKPKGLSITLEFDGRQSWVKPGTATDQLLKHEQGHFDAGILCQQEMIEQLTKASFEKQKMSAGLQALFNDILSRYIALNRQYDEETNHSKIKDQQEKWNLYFDGRLNR